MRTFSYIYHFLLALVMLALSVVALANGRHNLKLDMLPWKESQLTYALLILGLFGIIAVVLALKGTLRLLFFFWSLAVLVLMFKGYVFSPYSFAGSDEFTKALYLMAGAILACIGAWMAFRQQPVKR
jgi:ABC-type maltose transport system permease subunit